MDTDNRNGARGDTEMIPVVPFICKKVRLRWRGVTATKASQRHEGLAHGSTKGNPWGGKPAYTRFLGHTSTTESEAPKLLQQQATDYRWGKHKLGFPDRKSVV